MKLGDVITAIDGTTVSDYADVAARIGGKQPGEQVTVTIRRNGRGDWRLARRSAAPAARQGDVLAGRRIELEPRANGTWSVPVWPPLQTVLCLALGTGLAAIAVSMLLAAASRG